MQPDIANLIVTAEMEELAQPYGVFAGVHPNDFIYHYHKNNPPRNQREAAEVYYEIGKDSANRLLALIDQFSPRSADRKLSIFEFAAGYGGVSRHLKRFDWIDLVPCDIHKEAVTFIRSALDLPAVVSSPRPEGLDLSRRYDVVFALSFFTHMPAPTWTPWLERLLGLVREGGIFIFTTHGFKPWSMMGSPKVAEDGFWFAPVSEQKDLATEDYGSTITLPHYVFNRLRAISAADLIFYQPDYWGDLQDTFVVRRREGEVSSPQTIAVPPREIKELRAQLRALKSSASWRITRPLRTMQRWANRGKNS